MSKKAAIPSAWDDDWESQADAADAAAASSAKEHEEASAAVKLTKAERLALHKESQKKIWENAEEPDTPFFLAARSAVPLQQEFKPALKVLARKPAPKAVRTIDPVTGLARMTIEDDDEEEVVRRDLPTAEELRAQREEKQRRYNEARARILGPTPGTGTGTGPVVSPGEEGRGRGGGNGNGNGSGNGNGNTRGRGGRGAARQAGQESARPGSQGASGSGSGAGGKDLYDPNYTPKPTTIQKRPGSGRSTPKDEDQIIRAPRGPDGSNRGFGFARRGGRTS